MNARGVIIEASASFAITWQAVGEAHEIKWDQNKQSIELLSSDVYPDLEFTEASARATYVKYVSAARINELLSAINAKIEAILSPKSDDKPDEPSSPDAQDNMDTQPDGTSETGVSENDQQNKLGDYTVTVYAPNIKFIEGQRNTTTANAEILFKVSNNLQPELGGGGFDNTEKIYAEVKYLLGGKLLSKRFEFSEFEEDVTKFGGNLLVQVLPSIELKLKAKEDVYAYQDDESTDVKVTKAVRADLEKLPEEKLSEIENMILRIRQTRTAKKANEMQADKQSSNK